MKLFQKIFFKINNNLKKMIYNNSLTNLSSYIANKDRFIITTESCDLFNTYKELNKENPIVATHSGAFHADEVLATMLTKYTNNFKNAWVVRSRNDDILKQASIVLDVGAVFDPSTNRFDHHMKEFTENFDEVLNIKMSSAGLLYKFYGKQIIENILIEWNLFEQNKNLVEKIYYKIYENFIASVDGADNGINQFADDIKPRYQNSTSYGSRVGRLNPEWNDPDMDESSQFKLAWDVAEDEFLSQLKFVVKAFLPAYKIVKEAVDNRMKIHQSGKIIYLGQGCPWKEHLYTIEKELGIEGEILFAIYKGGHDYRVQTISINLGNFKFRRGLPEAWRGIRDSELAKVSGIEDIIFTHSSGFIGGAKSYESALKMAIESLK